MAENFYADVTLGGSINIKLHPVFKSPLRKKTVDDNIKTI